VKYISSVYELRRIRLPAVHLAQCPPSCIENSLKCVRDMSKGAQMYEAVMALAYNAKHHQALDLVHNSSIYCRRRGLLISFPSTIFLSLRAQARERVPM